MVMAVVAGICLLIGCLYFGCIGFLIVCKARSKSIYKSVFVPFVYIGNIMVGLAVIGAIISCIDLTALAAVKHELIIRPSLYVNIIRFSVITTALGWIICRNEFADKSEGIIEFFNRRRCRYDNVNAVSPQEGLNCGR